MDHEQRIYSRWLAFAVALGFGALVLSFLAYVTGLIPPGIPPEQLPRYWGLPVDEYIKATGAPRGWSWLHRLGEGDLLNFVGVAILGSATALCYARMLPLFVRAREWTFVAICVVQLAVLVFAASGVLAGTQ
jgi:hypothetical protein